MVGRCANERVRRIEHRLTTACPDRSPASFGSRFGNWGSTRLLWHGLRPCHNGGRHNGGRLCYHGGADGKKLLAQRTANRFTNRIIGNLK